MTISHRTSHSHFEQLPVISSKARNLVLPDRAKVTLPPPLSFRFSPFVISSDSEKSHSAEDAFLGADNDCMRSLPAVRDDSRGWSRRQCSSFPPAQRPCSRPPLSFRFSPLSFRSEARNLVVPPRSGLAAKPAEAPTCINTPFSPAPYRQTVSPRLRQQSPYPAQSAATA